MSTNHRASSHSLVVEVCAETPEACRAAMDGGAHRIELCTSLEVGGLTPSPALVTAALAHTSLPVHVLLRPTAETFVYSPAVYDAISRAITAYRALGIAGVVLGLCTPDSEVDTAHTRALVELAHPLPVTFHRAFDEIADQPAALEQIIATGCARVLTSGGAPDVVAGAPRLAKLVQQAGERIAIAVGGGLRLGNAAIVAAQTGARHFHASLREPEPVPAAQHSDLTTRTRELVRLLSHASPEAGRYTTAGTGAAFAGSSVGR